jgi:FKBP-type peptidyl-prolyl cis-trans isomerase SlyD
MPNLRRIILNMKITKGSKVAVSYVLRADGPEGELIEETRENEPLEFIFKEDPMLPHFESAIEGLTSGEHFKVSIPAKDAYGEEQEELFIEFPKSHFLVDGEYDEEMLAEGEIIPMESPDGEVIEGVVCEVTLNSVILDFNHPLAGENLYFEGKVESVA